MAEGTYDSTYYFSEKHLKDINRAVEAYKESHRTSKQWQESLKFTRRDADEIRALSQRPEVFPGHTVPSDTLWRCLSCQTHKPWNDFHHANRTASSYMTCKACFYKHIPDVSL